MTRFTVTRRAFGAGALASGGLLAAGRLDAQAAAGLTLGDVLGRIRLALQRGGVPWSEPTVDTIKIGEPSMPVTGIVSTFMGTLDVLRSAVELKANFIVSHEPIFYNHLDKTDFLADDPVYLAKLRFAKEHGLAVWRFHDHWHRIRPEPMSTAFAERLGWNSLSDPSNRDYPRHFSLPEIDLARLAEHIVQVLPSNSVRVIGDPALKVTKVATIGHTIDGLIAALDAADVVIAPEAREADSAEYMRDLLALGGRKALILIAHERGEENGMVTCAQWLGSLVPEVPVRFVSSGEPFAAPAGHCLKEGV